MEQQVKLHHFNQQPRRKAEFIMPPNTLKAKVGSGGLAEEILDKAESLLAGNTVDFMPLADMYLNTLMKAIDRAKDSSLSDASPEQNEELIVSMLYPAMQLKANGGMFRYPLVTDMADHMIQFLEVIDRIYIDTLEIVMAFHTTIRAIVLAKIMGDGGRHGEELLRALKDACERYFERHPGEKADLDLNFIQNL
jgi:hypothetical protein